QECARARRSRADIGLGRDRGATRAGMKNIEEVAVAIKTAIVTGAGTGVGKAITGGLLSAGYKVALVGRRKAVLAETAGELDKGGANTLILAADIGDAGAVAALFAEVKAKWGRLDLLVNNAGSAAPAIPMEDLTPQQWHEVVAANLTGAFFCTQQAI